MSVGGSSLPCVLTDFEFPQELTRPPRQIRAEGGIAHSALAVPAHLPPRPVWLSDEPRPAPTPCHRAPLPGPNRTNGARGAVAMDRVSLRNEAPITPV
ncbi:hypothetical protein AAFF_G00091970 [Aldrovandia affinis]|uniref:Uncharacterized protein n=1 Tax=Aldrovandia affinis TaxID=143900 RepID=A0AAD7WXF8_9TELE|nr:hypothetical protein AAFF_G00091970 [Aldrovandia affinis]